MRKTSYWLLLNTAAFIGVLVINTLANALPINGYNTGQISNLYPSLFTPAGITFSIWGIIYFLLLGFVIIQWSIAEQPWFIQFSRWFVVSCLANLSWILAWHYLLPGLALVIILVLLTSLTIIFLKLNALKFYSVKEEFFIRLPFNIYFAWICVATIANTAAWLSSIGWEGAFLSVTAWTVLMMGIAAALAFYVTLKFRSPAFAAVVIWALIGIYLRWQNTLQNKIAYGALVLIALLTGIFIYTLFDRFRARKIKS